MATSLWFLILGMPNWLQKRRGNRARILWTLCPMLRDGLWYTNWNLCSTPSPSLHGTLSTTLLTLLCLLGCHDNQPYKISGLPFLLPSTRLWSTLSSNSVSYFLPHRNSAARRLPATCNLSSHCHHWPCNVCL